MVNNYTYFITLAEEKNISKAADRLYISHQCLSKYLKNLEEKYGIAFFERTPSFKLTDAGKAYYQMAKQIELLENSLNNQIKDIQNSCIGTIRFGTTEGRYRIILPQLLTEYAKMYPLVKLEVECATSAQLCEKIERNNLDIALMNQRNTVSDHLDQQMVMNERLYLVISDHMLEQYFPEYYGTDKRIPLTSADLTLFAERKVPFVLNLKGLNSREIIENFLREKNIRLNCTLEMTQQDMQFTLAEKDIAACFCWAMFLPAIQQINKQSSNHLNFFPIKDLTTTNQLLLIKPYGKTLPAYGKNLVDLINRICTQFVSSVSK